MFCCGEVGGVIAARVPGADPKVLAAVILGAVAEQVTAEQLKQ